MMYESFTANSDSRRNVRSKTTICTVFTGMQLRSTSTIQGFGRVKIVLDYSATNDFCRLGWLRGTVVERRSETVSGELSCPTLGLQLTGDHLCG